MAIQIPESEKRLLMEGGIVGYGIRNPSSRNPESNERLSTQLK